MPSAPPQQQALLHIYVDMQILPPGMLVHVARHLGTTVLLTDPRATRFEIVLFCADRLTDEENNRLRVAFDQPTIGGPMEPHIMDDSRMPPDELPAVLRWPGPPIVECRTEGRVDRAVERVRDVRHRAFRLRSATMRRAM